MGTGWRRAFCTTIPRDREPKFVDKHLYQDHEHPQFSSQTQSSPSPSPRSCAKLGFLTNNNSKSSSSSTSNTPRLRCRTTATSNENSDNLVSPNLHCKTTTPKSNSSKTPRTRHASNPASPRSPFSILKNTLRLSKVIISLKPCCFVLNLLVSLFCG